MDIRERRTWGAPVELHGDVLRGLDNPYRFDSEYMTSVWGDEMIGWSDGILTFNLMQDAMTNNFSSLDLYDTKHKIMLTNGEVAFVLSRFPHVMYDLYELGDDVAVFVRMLRPIVPKYEALAWVLLLLEQDWMWGAKIFPIEVKRIVASNIGFDTFARYVSAGAEGLDLIQQLIANKVDSALVESLAAGSDG